MNTPPVDHEIAQGFLNTLHGHALVQQQLLCLWTKQNKLSRFFRSIASAAAHAVTMVGADVYVCMSTFAKELPPSKRGTLADCAGIGGVWADLDIAGPEHAEKHLPPTQADALRILDGLRLPEPTLIVHSGHGLQPYWLFEQPWLFADDADRQAAAAFVKAWGKTLEGHAGKLGYTIDAVWDLPRVLRVPGTLNHKNPGAVVPVTVLHESGRRYDRAELAAFGQNSRECAVSPFPASASTANTDGTDNTDSTATTAVSETLHSKHCGISDADVAFVLGKSAPREVHKNDGATLLFGRACLTLDLRRGRELDTTEYERLADAWMTTAKPFLRPDEPEQDYRDKLQKAYTNARFGLDEKPIETAWKVVQSRPLPRCVLRYRQRDLQLTAAIAIELQRMNGDHDFPYSGRMLAPVLKLADKKRGWWLIDKLEQKPQPALRCVWRAPSVPGAPASRYRCLLPSEEPKP